jgi:hypothetical protein
MKASIQTSSLSKHGLLHKRYKFLLLLLLADLAFIILHIIYVYTPHLPDRLFSLTLDRGYSEFFQYTKELWIAVLLLIAAIQYRKVLYAIFSLLFLYFLFDDSTEFHETFGALLSDFFHFQPAFGLRPVDFGELAVSAAFGLLFLILIAAGFYLSDRVTRRISLSLIGLIGLLVFFGVFLDMVEILIKDMAATRILRIIEEGGELFVMSYITWFAFRLDHFVNRVTERYSDPAMVASDAQ